MRTCERSAPRARGYSYLALLFFVAITSAALAALGRQWSIAAQRERERELEFRGHEIRRAIEAYLAATPAGQAGVLPRELDDLLVDRRGMHELHHLRRAYVDPFTGQADWELLPALDGRPGFLGVRSRSDQLLLSRSKPDQDEAERASSRVYMARPALGAPGQAVAPPQ
ncbi:type II secretion system protein [Pelomonas sp. SE-A7]|uniref:type II secretion system protein n=1 Tax=Pelomonas sp. SE-A7 TaxID=3054953 RepID=UPI00259C73EC|nr:type II secretion system protein [Pelomonas sp. SE-A7]MDM4767015.1 type II secretion system protein [Pelomonas sp. SE-A7]